MLKKFTLIFAFGVVLLLAGVCDAKIYKWIDQNGVLHISSSPPPVEFSDGNSNSAAFEEISVPSDNSTEINDTATGVIVFGRRSCGLTARMMRGLDNNNVPYLFQNVDSHDGKSHLNQRMEETGNARSRYMLPVIYMNGELMYSPQVVTVVVKYQSD
jgi:glutaredoxin